MNKLKKLTLVKRRQPYYNPFMSNQESPKLYPVSPERAWILGKRLGREAIYATPWRKLAAPAIAFVASESGDLLVTDVDGGSAFYRFGPETNEMLDSAIGLSTRTHGLSFLEAYNEIRLDHFKNAQPNFD